MGVIVAAMDVFVALAQWVNEGLGRGGDFHGFVMPVHATVL